MTEQGIFGKSFTGLYRASNEGVEKCRIDFAAADA